MNDKCTTIIAVVGKITVRDLLNVFIVHTVHNIELFTLLEEMTGSFLHLVIAINDYILVKCLLNFVYIII